MIRSSNDSFVRRGRNRNRKEIKRLHRRKDRMRRRVRGGRRVGRVNEREDGESERDGGHGSD